jgi:beta-N-acetylhexosaminidase
MAIEAGCDLLLVCESADQQVAALESVIHRVEQGRLSEARIDESVSRLSDLKKRFLGVNSAGPDAIKKWVGAERHGDLVREIEKKARAAVAKTA